MTEFIEPFNFSKIFMEYFLGGTKLLIPLVIIGYSFLAAKVQMSGRLFLVTLMLIGLLFAASMGQVMYIILFLIIGLITFRSISRMWT